MRRIQLLPVLIVAAACASEPQEPPATLVVTTTSLPDAVPNVAYAETLLATGGDDGYLWSVPVGRLPIGLLLDTRTGEISGTPRGSGRTFTVQVVSGDRQTAAQQLAITVYAVLAVTSSSLPNGQQTVAYSETLTAAGGVGNYMWSLAGDSLPTGLTLSPSSGEISGIPTVFGTSNFTVQVASGDGQAAQQALRIIVNAKFQSVSGGDGHSCGLTTAGAAYCWGWNASGQLGDGTKTDRNVAAEVLGGLTFQAVTAGGGGHSCGLTTVGAAYCWGSNTAGQLGDGTNTPSSMLMAVLGGLTFQSVTVGGFHSCGVTTAGAVYCWGWDIYGQLGDGTATNSSLPVAVSGGLSFQSVTGGDRHTCGVTTAGAVYCWGRNDHGQLGDGTTTPSNMPVAVLGGLIFQSVTGGATHSCGVTTARAVYCWGRNNLGQLGDGTATSSSLPVAVSGGLSFQSVTGGARQTCGVTTAGAVYCWGDNLFGQLGDGTNTDRNVPVAVSGGLTFRSVTGGGLHSCGLTTAGAAYCWGWNRSGPLGDGTNTDSNVPVLVRAP